MNPERFYMPGYMGMRNIPISNYMSGTTNVAPRAMGLFSRFANGIRSVNWRGLLTNANKTLDVVNQAIPLVRKAGPMVNNMKSMLKIAKAFGSETTSNNRRVSNNSIRQSNSIDSNSDKFGNENLVIEKEVQNDNAPNFFV